MIDVVILLEKKKKKILLSLRSKQNQSYHVSMVMNNSRRVEGDVATLREELSEFLFEKYEQEFISQANELMQKVVFRGNFDADFKEFLKMKGF